MVQPFQFPSSRALHSPGVHTQDTLAVVAIADRALKGHVAQALAHHGVRVVMVATHPALQAAMEANAPALLIVDLALGKGKGLTTLQSALAANPGLHAIGIASQYSEQACGTALRFGARSYKPVERLLVLGRESVGLRDEDAPDAAAIQHENLRGPDYYH